MRHDRASSAAAARRATRWSSATVSENGGNRSEHEPVLSKVEAKTDAKRNVWTAVAVEHRGALSAEERPLVEVRLEAGGGHRPDEDGRVGAVQSRERCT